MDWFWNIIEDLFFSGSGINSIAHDDVMVVKDHAILIERPGGRYSLYPFETFTIIRVSKAHGNVWCRARNGEAFIIRTNVLTKEMKKGNVYVT